MKTTTEVVTTLFYVSEVMPDVRTSDKAEGEVIAWADANPVVWKIATQHRSKVFGQTANTYAGYQRGPSPHGALMRANVIHDELMVRSDSIFSWRAQFTIGHYQDKGFKSGFFQQWDGAYYRHCMMLDYTPKTLESVIDKFQEWCQGSACPYETVNIQLDKKVVRKVKP